LYIGSNADVYSSVHVGAPFGNLGAIDANGSEIIDSNCTVFVTAPGRFSNLIDHSDPRVVSLKKGLTLEEVRE